jgi:hypothetical protein
MNYGNIYTSIGSLTRPVVKNSGLCLIQFCKWEDVSQWPSIDPNTGICNTPIQLVPGANWNIFFAPDNDRAFTEQQQDSAPGSYYRVQVTGYIPGNDQATLQKIAPMPYHQYAMIVKDRDGLLRLIGDRDSGAEFVSNYTSGNQSSIRRRSITFSWETVNPCPVYPPPPPDTAIQGEFSNEFLENEFNV